MSLRRRNYMLEAVLSSGVPAIVKPFGVIKKTRKRKAILSLVSLLGKRRHKLMRRSPAKIGLPPVPRI